MFTVQEQLPNLWENIIQWVANPRLQLRQKTYRWKGTILYLILIDQKYNFQKFPEKSFHIFANLKQPNEQRWESVNQSILWSEKEIFLQIWSGEIRGLNRCEHKLKNCFLRTAARRFFNIYFFLIATWKRNGMKCSLLNLTDTKMNMWYYKLAREPIHIKNNKEFKMRKVNWWFNFYYENY